MLRTLFTRPRAIFASLLAIGAASLAFIATERKGDPQVVITEVERQINAIEVIIARHTYQVKNADSPKPADKSRALYELSGIQFRVGPRQVSASSKIQFRVGPRQVSASSKFSA